MLVSPVTQYGFNTVDAVALAEAEDGILTGVTVADSEPGYSGSGYIYANSFDASGDSISVSLTPPVEGDYELIIGYYGGHGDKYQYIDVNGANIGNIYFPQTTDWAAVSAGTVHLNAEPNTITMRHHWGWMHVDYFRIPSCPGDGDFDFDVDGSDLAIFAVGGSGADIVDMASEFGRDLCL